MKVPGEYTNVAKHLAVHDTGELARDAHATPITRGEAVLLTLKLTGVTPIFRGYRGRATKPCRTGKHSGKISLPARDGVRPRDGVPYLRLGIVLHECAHILAWRTYHGRTIRPHGPTFCQTFVGLLRAHANSTDLA